MIYFVLLVEFFLDYCRVVNSPKMTDLIDSMVISKGLLSIRANNWPGHVGGLT